MVHTESASRGEHVAHLTDISVAAFTGAAYHRFVRPRYMEYPDGAFYHSLHKIRNSVISPDKVVRVALADDSDPWVDVGLTGLDAEQTKWMRGEIIDGKWQSAELVDGELRSKVCEGRALGYAIWERKWPEAPADAKRAKERGGSGTVWPVDRLWKKAERTAFSLSSKYFNLINPDPAGSPENLALVMTEGLESLLPILKPLTERSKHVGHISLDSIAVDPTFYRRGVGARLMRWGLERAETEGCPIILVATSAGQLLYQKLGFEAHGVVTVRELTGDRVMVYWPKTFKEGTDVQDRVVQTVDQTAVATEKEAASGALAGNGSI